MRSISSLLLAAVALVGPLVAHAQGTGGASRLEWPRTFTGQPDFAFTRTEAVQDAITNARQQRENPPSPATLEQLVNDFSQLDPLRLAEPVAFIGAVSGTQDVSGTAKPVSLMEKLLSNVVELPSFNATYKTDLTEFRSTLMQTISQTVASWQPQAGRYSYGALVKGLTLQAIVTSPQRYAVINGNRYGEGESFQIQAPITVPDQEIIAALNAKMPPPESLSPEVYKQYQEAYEAAIAAYASGRSANAAVGMQTLMLPVVVRSIEARRVLLSVNGEEHELSIRFAY